MVEMLRYLGILLLALVFIQVYGLVYGVLAGKQPVKEAAAHGVQTPYTYMVFD